MACSSICLNPNTFFSVEWPKNLQLILNHFKTVDLESHASCCLNPGFLESQGLGSALKLACQQFKQELPLRHDDLLKDLIGILSQADPAYELLQEADARDDLVNLVYREALILDRLNIPRIKLWIEGLRSSQKHLSGLTSCPSPKRPRIHQSDDLESLGPEDSLSTLPPSAPLQLIQEVQCQLHQLQESFPSDVSFDIDFERCQSTIQALTEVLSDEDEMTTAFIGTNGVGKSFIINLLLRATLCSEATYVWNYRDQRRNSFPISHDLLFQGLTSKLHLEALGDLLSFEKFKVFQVSPAEEQHFQKEEKNDQWFAYLQSCYPSEHAPSQHSENMKPPSFVLPSCENLTITTPISLQIQFGHIFHLKVEYIDQAELRGIKRIFDDKTAEIAELRDNLQDPSSLLDVCQMYEDRLRGLFSTNGKIEPQVKELLGATQIYTGNGRSLLVDQAYVSHHLQRLFGSEGSYQHGIFKKMTLYVPSFILEKNHLIDTPGLLDANNFRLSETRKSIEKADNIFWVMNREPTADKATIDELFGRDTSFAARFIQNPQRHKIVCYLNNRLFSEQAVIRPLIADQLTPEAKEAHLNVRLRCRDLLIKRLNDLTMKSGPAGIRWRKPADAADRARLLQSISQYATDTFEKSFIFLDHPYPHLFLAQQYLNETPSSARNSLSSALVDPRCTLNCQCRCYFCFPDGFGAASDLACSCPCNSGCIPCFSAITQGYLFFGIFLYFRNSGKRELWDDLVKSLQSLIKNVRSPISPPPCLNPSSSASLRAASTAASDLLNAYQSTKAIHLDWASNDASGPFISHFKSAFDNTPFLEALSGWLDSPEIINEFDKCSDFSKKTLQNQTNLVLGTKISSLAAALRKAKSNSINGNHRDLDLDTWLLPPSAFYPNYENLFVSMESALASLYQNLKNSFYSFSKEVLSTQMGIRRRSNQEERFPEDIDNLIKDFLESELFDWWDDIQTRFFFRYPYPFTAQQLQSQITNKTASLNPGHQGSRVRVNGLRRRAVTNFLKEFMPLHPNLTTKDELTNCWNELINPETQVSHYLLIELRHRFKELIIYRVRFLKRILLEDDQVSHTINAKKSILLGRFLLLCKVLISKQDEKLKDDPVEPTLQAANHNTYLDILEETTRRISANSIGVDKHPITSAGSSVLRNLAFLRFSSDLLSSLENTGGLHFTSHRLRIHINPVPNPTSLDFSPEIISQTLRQRQAQAPRFSCTTSQFRSASVFRALSQAYFGNPDKAFELAYFASKSFLSYPHLPQEKISAYEQLCNKVMVQSQSEQEEIDPNHPSTLFAEALLTYLHYLTNFKVYFWAQGQDRPYSSHRSTEPGFHIVALTTKNHSWTYTFFVDSRTSLPPPQPSIHIYTHPTRKLAVVIDTCSLYNAIDETQNNGGYLLDSLPESTLAQIDWHIPLVQQREIEHHAKDPLKKKWSNSLKNMFSTRSLNATIYRASRSNKVFTCFPSKIIVQSDATADRISTKYCPATILERSQWNDFQLISWAYDLLWIQSCPVLIVSDDTWISGFFNMSEHIPPVVTWRRFAQLFQSNGITDHPAIRVWQEFFTPEQQKMLETHQRTPWGVVSIK